VGGLSRAVEVGVERSVSLDSDTGGWG